MSCSWSLKWCSYLFATHRPSQWTNRNHKWISLFGRLKDCRGKCEHCITNTTVFLKKKSWLAAVRHLQQLEFSCEKWTFLNLWSSKESALPTNETNYILILRPVRNTQEKSCFELQYLWWRLNERTWHLNWTSFFLKLIPAFFHINSILSASNACPHDNC